MAAPAYNDPEYLAARSRLLATRPNCAYCSNRATEADHLPPLSRHEHRSFSAGCCRLVPSCSECAREQGFRLTHHLKLFDPDVVLVPDAEPDGFGVDDAIWNVPWLDDLRNVPDNATWPRLMSPPHPKAVSSLGPDFVCRAEARERTRLRWWQQLAATRLLEIDANGALVWEEAVLSTARQVGKSWLLRELGFWRLDQCERFGEPQLILHTGKDLAVTREVQRPARVWAKQQPMIYKVREVNGQEEIELRRDSSRWMLRAKDSVYGYSASLALVDEAWRVKAIAIDEGLVPTMIERNQSQILFLSTAHRQATTLMLGRRAVALKSFRHPEDGPLLMEWSAPRTLDLEDVDGWRMASPEWTDRRQKLIAKKLHQALTGEIAELDEPDPIEAFRAQWLNQWPQRFTPSGKGEPLVEFDAWIRAHEDASPVGALVLAADDWQGRGCAGAAAGLTDDGRVMVGGWTFDQRDAMFAWLASLAAAHEGSTLIVPSALAADATAAELPVGRVVTGTGVKIRDGLAAMRSLLADKRLVHDGSSDLDTQVDRVRLVSQSTGLSIVPGQRADLLRATAWAVDACRLPPPAPQIM